MRVTATFVGGADCGDAQSVTFRDVVFPLGKPVNLSIVTVDGQAMLAKLKGNRFFEVKAIAEDIEEVKVETAPAEVIEVSKPKAKPSKSKAKDADGPADA